MLTRCKFIEDRRKGGRCLFICDTRLSSGNERYHDIEICGWRDHRNGRDGP